MIILYLLFILMFPHVSSACDYDFTNDYVDCNCQNIPLEIYLHPNNPDIQPLRLLNFAHECLNEMFPPFDNYHYHYYSTCSDAVNCQSVMDNSTPVTGGYIGQSWPTSVGIAQDGMETNVSMIAYFCEVPGTCSDPPRLYNEGIVYLLTGFYGCPQSFMKQIGDTELTVQAYNNEVYSYAYRYRGYEYVFQNGISVKLHNEPVGTLPPEFTRQDILDLDGFNGGKGGHFNFITTIPGTQCGTVHDWKFVGHPEFWWSCKRTGGNCGNQGCIWGQWYPNEDCYGVDMIGLDWNEWYSPEDYEKYQIYRYPIDKYFNPTGPLEIYKDADESVNTIEPWGYFTSPGHEIETDIEIQKGYKYRFFTVIDGIRWSLDFAGWPCSYNRTDGGGVKNEGSGVLSKGKGARSKGSGGYETKN